MDVDVGAVRVAALSNLNTCNINFNFRPYLHGFRPRSIARLSNASNRPIYQQLEHKSMELMLKGGVSGDNSSMDFALIIRALGKAKRPQVAEKLFLKMINEGILPEKSVLCAMMICYANNGFFIKAQSIWNEILHSCFLPEIQIISELFAAYGNIGQFDEVIRIVHQLSSRGLRCLPQVYKLAIYCFGMRGQLAMMETMLKEMSSRGFLVDSDTANAYIIYYSKFGSFTELETAYGRFTSSRFHIQEEAVRAMSFAYIRGRKFYKLGEVLREVGLGRKNMGNLLWNLLLLSHAANFKMKSLQREFLKMVDAGFNPDLTTFNIRALAFSKMSLFWDLHLTLEHMNYNKVIPDLVTYGSVIDAYLDRRLGRNLDFALSKMRVGDFQMMLTDPLVFQAFGKGEFHASSEAFLEFKRGRPWTYRELIATYLRKESRSSQVFWNY